MNIYEKIGTKIGEIENEFRRLGRWQDVPLEKEKYENMGSFGMKTMTIEQWIQFILIPRVNYIIKKQKEFPVSEFAVYAVRNLDGDPDAANLLQLIIELDAIVNGDLG